MIFLSLYVFLRFLTWRARHSQPLFGTRICFLCNQRAFARLVIRRAVEMKNPRFVGCSLFIGLIGLGSEFPEMKYLNKYDASHSSPASPLASSP